MQITTCTSRYGEKLLRQAFQIKFPLKNHTIYSRYMCLRFFQAHPPPPRPPPLPDPTHLLLERISCSVRSSLQIRQQRVAIYLTKRAHTILYKYPNLIFCLSFISQRHPLLFSFSSSTVGSVLQAKSLYSAVCGCVLGRSVQQAATEAIIRCFAGCHHLVCSQQHPHEHLWAAAAAADWKLLGRAWVNIWILKTRNFGFTRIMQPLLISFTENKCETLHSVWHPERKSVRESVRGLVARRKLVANKFHCSFQRARNVTVLFAATTSGIMLCIDVGESRAKLSPVSG